MRSSSDFLKIDGFFEHMSITNWIHLAFAPASYTPVVLLV